jgi:hypothetical protein
MCCVRILRRGTQIGIEETRKGVEVVGVQPTALHDFLQGIDGIYSDNRTVTHGQGNLQAGPRAREYKTMKGTLAVRFHLVHDRLDWYIAQAQGSECCHLQIDRFYFIACH